MGKYKVGHRYSEEFKKDAVKMVISEKQSPRIVADKIEVEVSVLNNWLVKYLLVELEKLETENLRLKRELAKSPNERLSELENENLKLKEHVDTLKKTIQIFSVSK